MKWWQWGLISFGILLVAVLLFFVSTKQFVNASESDLPQFVKHDVVDTTKVITVSKFRSGAGHSNPGWPETCRSMKHYFVAYDSTKPIKELGQDFSVRSQRPTAEFAVDIYSPVDGTLSKSATGEGDDQLNISVNGYRGYSIRLEHVHLNEGLSKINAHVLAGQKIATVWNNQSFDVSVFYHYFRGDELFSYFSVMPDSIFAAYQQQGATSRTEFIFTKAYRDTHPLECLNDRAGTPSFAKNGQVTQGWTDENLVHLKGYNQAVTSGQKNDLNSINDFASCAKHFPVLETSPRLCKTDSGQSFTEGPSPNR